MYEEKRIADYSKKLAKEHDIPPRLANEILKVGLKNILEMMKGGEDIRIGGKISIIINRFTRADNILKKRAAYKKNIEKWRSRLESEAKAEPAKPPQ